MFPVRSNDLSVFAVASSRVFLQWPHRVSLFCKLLQYTMIKHNIKRGLTHSRIAIRSGAFIEACALRNACAVSATFESSGVNFHCDLLIGER